MKQKKGMTLDEIKARKAAIKSSYKDIESNIVTDVLNPKNIALGLTSFAISKLTNKNSSNAPLRLISTNDNGRVKILDTAMNILSNPVVNAFLSKTKRSWVHWQLFNIGFFVAKKFYNHYFYDKVEIIDEPTPPQSTFQKILSGAKEYVQGIFQK